MSDPTVTREKRRKHDDAHRPAFVRTGGIAPTDRFVPTMVCPRCRGDGHEPGFGRDVAPAAVAPCAQCKGSGEVPQ